MDSAVLLQKAEEAFQRQELFVAGRWQELYKYLSGEKELPVWHPQPASMTMTNFWLAFWEEVCCTVGKEKGHTIVNTKGLREGFKRYWYLTAIPYVYVYITKNKLNQIVDRGIKVAKEIQ